MRLAHQLTPPRETESGEADAEKRERRGFRDTGNITSKLEVERRRSEIEKPSLGLIVPARRVSRVVLFRPKPIVDGIRAGVIKDRQPIRRACRKGKRRYDCGIGEPLETATTSVSRIGTVDRVTDAEGIERGGPRAGRPNRQRAES